MDTRLIHNLFNRYCDKNEIGNATLELRDGISIKTDKEKKWFGSQFELLTELNK